MTPAATPARVGILGGMGPAATADFYRKLIEATPAARDQDHLPVLMEADPTIPDRADGYLRGGPSPLPALRRAAQALQARGAQLIAMPCNTAHLWYDEIAPAVSVPMAHIVDAAVEDLCEQMGERANGALRVGLLGTDATIAGQLYPLRAARDNRALNWQWILPLPSTQATLQAGIAAIKGADAARGTELIERALEALRAQGVDAVVYACTEVPLALGSQPRDGVACCDSNTALAKLTVRLAQHPA
jgi:aspartate racemase